MGGGSRAGWGWRRTRSEPTMVGRDIADHVGVQSRSPAMNDGRVASQAGFRMPARRCDAPLFGIRAGKLTARVCQGCATALQRSVYNLRQPRTSSQIRFPGLRTLKILRPRRTGPSSYVRLLEVIPLVSPVLRVSAADHFAETYGSGM